MNDFAPTIERWLEQATDQELQDGLGLDHVKHDPDLAQRIRGEIQRRERRAAAEYRRQNGYAG